MTEHATESDHTPRCSCLSVDHILLPPQGGCAVHGDPSPRTVPEVSPPELTDEQVDAACAWSDYRKDYGVSTEHLSAAHKAFLAGWKAAREGDQAGALR